MARLLIVSLKINSGEEFFPRLSSGHAISRVSYVNVVPEIQRTMPDLILMELVALQSDRQLTEELGQLLERHPIPVIATVNQRELNQLRPNLPINDFIITPLNTAELETRIRRLLQLSKAENGEIIQCQELAIDQALDEAIAPLRDSEPCSVLLDRVWGTDYFGGDRTVDVHIRRLRSKIENLKNPYIETVRNIGYSFRSIPGKNTSSQD